VTTSGHTKHVDIWFHYVHKFVEEGFVKSIFVRTPENYADRFTKNLHGARVFRRYSEDILRRSSEFFFSWFSQIL
jgi:hypothetical protein